MNKPKVMFKANSAVPSITDHLRKYGMDLGVDTANEMLIDLVEWACDMGHGDERPCPITKAEIKRRIKW